MPQSLSSVIVHAVFSTKNRVPHLADADLRAEAFAYIGGVSKALQCPPIAVGGHSDHAHVLAYLARTSAVSDWVKELKRVSSVFLSQRIDDFAWQTGYAAFSVDPSSVDQVAAYIRHQEDHHRKVSFQDELRALLREHGLDWDERYLWD